MIGSVDKMITELLQPVQYLLPVGKERMPLNPLIGQVFTLRYTGQIFCTYCQKKTRKSFGQGYCYPCFIRLAQCDQCIIKPHLCHFSAGTCREPEWGEAFCFQPHIVYLANSSGLKVGITRQSQIPTRWIDQGATQALPIVKVASRYIAGLIEVAIAQHVSDKTHWQRMLKGPAEALDLLAERDRLLAACRPDLDALQEQYAGNIEFCANQPMVEIEYPVAVYPDKVKAFNLEQTPEVSGVLQGIKGQYLIFDGGVINIRKYTGYELAVLD